MLLPPIWKNALSSKLTHRRKALLSEHAKHKSPASNDTWNMEHNTTISLSFYSKYHRFWGGFLAPFCSWGYDPNLIRWASVRPRMHAALGVLWVQYFNCCSAWLAPEWKPEPRQLQIGLGYKDNCVTEAFPNLFKGLLALVLCHLIQPRCWHSCGKDCHGPPSPPYTALPGAAARPLSCSCTLELCKCHARLGCISLKNQRRGWWQNQRGKRLRRTHLNSTQWAHPQVDQRPKR